MSAKRAISVLFFAIEINLVLWLALLGILWAKGGDVTLARNAAIVGAAFAAIVQHWAYYAVRRATKATQ